MPSFPRTARPASEGIPGRLLRTSSFSLNVWMRSIKELTVAGQRGRVLCRSLATHVADGLRYLWRHPVLRNFWCD